MSVEVKEISYENYGKCVQISNGVVDVAVTIERGPRIIRLGFVEEANVLYNDLERRHVYRDEKILARYGQEAAYYCYGGHRVCLSPEKMPETYSPDNGPVVYGIGAEGVSFTPARQKQNEMQLGFQVLMSEDAKDIMVVHTAKNVSREKQAFALSAITMMPSGGTVVIPLNTDGAKPEHPNRTIALWPGTGFQDPRLSVTDRFITLRHEPAGESPVRLGTNDAPGWVAFWKDGHTLLKRFVHNAQAVYADFGCSCECALCGDYTEIRSLSPFYGLEPGEGIRHVENISLFRTPEPPAPEDDAVQAFFDRLK
jgi:hypothetical protein